MIETVMNNVSEYNLIEENDNIVAAVSGGHDSMAMVYALVEVRKSIDFNIIVAHVNHGVRGDEAKRDQEFVKNQAKKLGLEFTTRDVDMNGYAREHKITAEEAGRFLRYSFFREIIKEKGSGKIAVAHNRNDQAETLLMRIMRGTGIDGLKGMDFKSGDVIRPLLDISRTDIEEYIEENHIETVLDKTNLVPIYSRNKVRLELIPYIKENFNQNIVDTLWRLSQSSKLDVSYLDEVVEEKYKLVMKYESKHSIILNRLVFAEENPSIKARLLRKSIEKIHGSMQGIGEVHISSLVELFDSNETGKKIDLPNDIVGKTSYDNLIIERKSVEKTDDFECNLTKGENVFTEIGVSIHISVYTDKLSVGKSKNKKLFDFDKVMGKLRIRNRKNGDRLVPFGMKGSKKVKDYFIDNKVPRDLRDRIPILADDENIIWIIGYGISDLYKVTDETKNFLVVEYKNI